jgi:hypothetical protein
MRTFRRLVAALIPLLCLAGLVATPSLAAPPPTGPLALDDAAKRAQELDILAEFVPHAETFWRESDLTEPNTGWYSAVGSGVSQPRGAGDIAFVEATLLYAEPDRTSFGGVSRSTMLDHTIQSIRHEALTNMLSGTTYHRWGGNTWQASLETYGWAYAAHLLWSDLDDDTRALVQRVVTGEANILITKPIATATPGNTGAEDNAWNSPTPALAAVMFPNDPSRAAWLHTSQKLAINASSTAADATSSTPVDGAPLSSWVASANLNPDLTIENHGFFNPIYQQVAPLLVGDAAIFYAQGGLPQPEAFSFRVQDVWQTILGRLADDNGDITMPAGQDWISKDYQHLDYLSILATRFHDADASVLESRALQTVAARQATHQDGSILAQPDLGYESMIAKRMAGSWWNHTLFGPSPVPTQQQYDAARAATSGVTQLPSVDVIAARLPGASAYMSWDTESPMGLWIPREEQHLDDPLLTYYAKGSLIGSATGTVSAYSCACADDRFSTAGVIGGRDFSMTTFPDGTSLLLDRGTGSTFTYAMERIPGITGDRTIYSSGGAGLGTLPGTWVDAADRMGMVVLGGGGITAADVDGTNDTRVITGSAGTGTGNRGAALFPDVTHQATADLASHVAQPAVPDGWSALTARAADGTERLAVARWGGAASVPLTISDDRGAPVPVEPAQLSGHSATFPVARSAPASEGETLRFFVAADGPLLAHQDGENRAVLTNTGTAPVRAQVTYVGGGALTHVIAPGETVTARTVDGRLTLAGPEYEHLLSAGETLTALQTSLDQWRAAGQISPADANRLGGLTAAALAQIGAATTTATATNPDTASETAVVAAASRTVGQLTAGPSTPPDVRAAIDQSRQDAAAQVARAAGALTVVLDVRPLAPALPGEPLTLRVIAFNRGLPAATAGTVTLAEPDGWMLPNRTPAFGALPPGGSARVDLTGTVAPDASGHADLTATLGYTADGPRTARATATVDVQPLYTITAPSVLPLASGGWNRASAALANNAPHPVDVDVAANAPSGVTATLDEAHVTVPAGGTATVNVDLTQTGQASGTGELTIIGHTSTGVAATASTQLRYSDNLALNPTGTPFPAAFADSSQATFPPGLATDGNASTFWVSGGPVTQGNGPTPTHPIAMGVDLGHPVTVGSVTVAGRTGYGPKTYTVQTSTDGQSWQDVAQVTSGPNGPRTTAFTPTTARYLRLWITDGYDTAGSPPRNTQVAELQIQAG